MTVVADALGAEPLIFETLNRLTNKGFAAVSRRYTTREDAHTARELERLREAIRISTRRVAEWEADRAAALPHFAIVDFPAL